MNDAPISTKPCSRCKKPVDGAFANCSKCREYKRLHQANRGANRTAIAAGSSSSSSASAISTGTEQSHSVRQTESTELKREEKQSVTQEDVLQTPDGTIKTHRLTHETTKTEQLVLKVETEVTQKYRTYINKLKAFSQSSQNLAIWQEYLEDFYPDKQELDNMPLNQIYDALKQKQHDRVDRKVGDAMDKYAATLQKWHAADPSTRGDPPIKPVCLWTPEDYTQQVSRIESVFSMAEAKQFFQECNAKQIALLDRTIPEEDLEELAAKLEHYAGRHGRFPDGVVVTPTSIMDETLKVGSTEDTTVTKARCTVDHPDSAIIQNVLLSTGTLHLVESTRSQVQSAWEELANRPLELLPKSFVPKGLLAGKAAIELSAFRHHIPNTPLLIDMFAKARSDRSFIPPGDLPNCPMDEPDIRSYVDQMTVLIKEGASRYMGTDTWNQFDALKSFVTKLDQEAAKFGDLRAELDVVRTKRLKNEPYVPESLEHYDPDEAELRKMRKRPNESDQAYNKRMKRLTGIDIASIESPPVDETPNQKISRLTSFYGYKG